MKLLTALLKEHPEFEPCPGKYKRLEHILGECGSVLDLAEAVVKSFDRPQDILQIYEEFQQYLQSEFLLTKKKAQETTNTLLGTATAACREHRPAWFAALPDIYHFLLGRKILEETGRLLTDLTVTLNNPLLQERFETYIRDMKPTLFGNISYEATAMPGTLRVYFDGHVGEAERTIGYIAGLFEGIRGLLQQDGIHDAGFKLSYKTTSIKENAGDLQAYWEEKLQYARVGNRWMRKNIQGDVDSTTVWVYNAYSGKYSTPCMNGTPAPDGLHITFCFSQEEIESSVRTTTGWTFMGKQAEDFLQAAQVGRAEELQGRPMRIYESGAYIVGVEIPRG